MYLYLFSQTGKVAEWLKAIDCKVRSGKKNYFYSFKVKILLYYA